MNDNIHTTREVSLPPGVSYSELKRKFPALKNVSKREFLNRPQLQIQILGERLDGGDKPSPQPSNGNFQNETPNISQDPNLQQDPGNTNQMQQFAYGGTDDFYSEQKPNEEGLIEFSGGGTHEQNSLGGIPIGQDRNGNMNTVEDGETKYAFDDGEYIFSNRIDTSGNFKSAKQAAVTSPMQSIQQYSMGGGLSSKSRGSDENPYPSVRQSDFAGGNRSYPIPTEADAIDALRLAGLHGRDDVRAKVFAKYPQLQHADGGFLDTEMEDYNNTLYNTPIDDGFADSTPLTSPLTKTLERAYGGGWISHTYGAGNNLAYAEGGEIDPIKGNISQAKDQGILDKIDDITLNPLTSLGYAARGQDIPQNLGAGLKSGAVKRNTLDNVLDFVNPAYYLNSATQGIQNLSQGDFAGAAGEALNFVPAMGPTRGFSKVAKQERKAKALFKAITGTDNVAQHTIGKGIIGHAYGGNLVLQSLNKIR